VQVIDEDHKELFRHVDHFISAAEAATRKTEFMRLMDFLNQYTSDHFRHEEDLMELRGCPAKQENKEGHQWFTTEIGALKTRAGVEGISEPLREYLMAMMVQWLEAHIAGVDVKLRETFN
jgi:hemerythrin-like metal-binding protein